MDVNRQEADGRTALSRAIVCRHSRDIKVLLDLDDINPSLSDNDGWTLPVHVLSTVTVLVSCDCFCHIVIRIQTLSTTMVSSLEKVIHNDDDRAREPNPKAPIWIGMLSINR
jgi:hypothetical protein